MNYQSSSSQEEACFSAGLPMVMILSAMTAFSPTVAEDIPKLSGHSESSSDVSSSTIEILDAHWYDNDESANVFIDDSERAYLKSKLRLMGLIEGLKGLPENPFVSGGETVKTGSIDTAIAFLNLMPTVFELPKIAADSEGDILFAWDSDSKCILTVEDRLLHFIVNPGMATAEYYDDIYFQRENISSKIFPSLLKRG